MPLLKFHLRKGRAPDEVEHLLDVAHGAMVRSFNVPERDRYQIVHEHEPSHFKALDTGLGIERSERFVLLEVVSRPRASAEKQAFYRNLCEALESECATKPSDVMVSIVENADEDWSFGHGRAQFVLGDL